MLAVDTNIVVRLLVDDDPRQGAIARRLFESDEIFISVTVLLESAWVLESVYGLGRGEVAKALRALFGLANVRVEDAANVASALDAVDKGLDLADALHLSRLPAGAEFVTFDRALAKAGKKVRPVRLV